MVGEKVDDGVDEEVDEKQCERRGEGSRLSPGLLRGELVHWN